MTKRFWILAAMLVGLSQLTGCAGFCINGRDGQMCVTGMVQQRVVAVQAAPVAVQQQRVIVVQPTCPAGPMTFWQAQNSPCPTMYYGGAYWPQR